MAKVIELLMILRAWSWVLVLVGAAFMLPVAIWGVAKLRKAAAGPAGEVLVGCGLLMQLLVVAAWWGPLFLRG